MYNKIIYERRQRSQKQNIDIESTSDRSIHMPTDNRYERCLQELRELKVDAVEEVARKLEEIMEIRKTICQNADPDIKIGDLFPIFFLNPDFVSKTRFRNTRFFCVCF